MVQIGIKKITDTHTHFISLMTVNEDNFITKLERWSFEVTSFRFLCPILDLETVITATVIAVVVGASR